MKKNLKFLASLFFAILSCFPFQICPSQAVDDEVQKVDDSEGNKMMCIGEESGLVEMNPTIPPVAQGYEDIYQRFLNGALVYRPPNPANYADMVTLPIRDLANPLDGTFDLSRCGDTGEYLSISTGYRKGMRPENASKIEIWLAPRFLIEKEIDTTASYFKPIMGDWEQDAPVGMFWTWGGNDDMGQYDYLVTENIDNLSKINLYENWRRGRHVCAWLVSGMGATTYGHSMWEVRHAVPDLTRTRTFALEFGN